MQTLLPHHWPDEKPSFIGIVLIIIGLLILATSCTTSKHTTKSTVEAHTETQTNSTATNSVVTNSTVTEVATGFASPPKDSTELDFDQSDLDQGITEITPTATTTIYMDVTTKRVKVKSVFAPKPVAFNINKTTITQKAEGRTTVTAKKETAHLKQAVKTKDKEVTWFSWWWLLLLLLIPIWKCLKFLFG